MKPHAGSGALALAALLFSTAAALRRAAALCRARNGGADRCRAAPRRSCRRPSARLPHRRAARH